MTENEIINMLRDGGYSAAHIVQACAHATQLPQRATERTMI